MAVLNQVLHTTLDNLTSAQLSHKELVCEVLYWTNQVLVHYGYPLPLQEIVELKMKGEVESVKNSLVLLERSAVTSLRSENEVWLYSIAIEWPTAQKMVCFHCTCIVIYVQSCSEDHSVNRRPCYSLHTGAQGSNTETKRWIHGNGQTTHASSSLVTVDPSLSVPGRGWEG